MKIFRRRNKYYCKAASSSLLFQPSGDVGPCYYNRGYIFGKYPEKSIDEIWDSINRKNLIKSIKNAKFNLGCYQCKKDIDAGLFYSSGISKYDFIEIDKKESKFPSLMAFQLDNICNLECIMCSGEYSHLIRKNREKALAYISPYNDNFVEQLKKYIPHLKIAVFTGGEPLLIPLYYKIWDKIIRLNPNMSVTITSNGTVLNDSIKEYFEKMNVSITVGIDAVDAEVYENIRVNARLDKTLKNIEYFNNYCSRKNTKFEIKTLITPQNYKVVQNLFYYFSERGIIIMPKLAVMPFYSSMMSLSVEELDHVVLHLSTLIYNEEDEIAKINFSRLNEMTQQIKQMRNNLILDIDNYKSYSLVDLKVLLIEYLKTTYESKVYLSPNEFDFYQKQIDIVFDKIDDEGVLRNAVLCLIKIPGDLILNEMNRSELEKFIARVKQTGEYYI
ncbi:MAG: radical SAM protein [Bacteroidales bacterium]|nr:radical SAM protein [Bacteroidales bacterium]